MAGPAFEPGPLNPAPLNFDYHTRPPNDPLAMLADEPAARLVALRQRKVDLFNQTPSAEDVSDARGAVVDHQNRIAFLTKVRGEGGPGLNESAPQVRETRRQLKRAEKELARLIALKDPRTARAQAAGQLERAVTDWLVNGGIPGGCTVEPVEDPPLSELLIKGDGGRIDAAMTRYRREVETHAEALRKLRAAPFTKAEAVAAIAREINQRADAATPSVERVTLFLEPITFATTVKHGLAQNLDPKVPPTIVGYETVDTLGALCWMFRKEMIAKLQGMVTESDGAVSREDREIEEARIAGLLLEAERREAACIWAAEAKDGTIIDFRSTTAPQAAIGVRLVTRPHAPQSGTSPEHAIDIVGGRNW